MKRKVVRTKKMKKKRRKKKSQKIRNPPWSNVSSYSIGEC